MNGYKVRSALLYYDTTNFFNYHWHSLSELSKRGRNKKNRNDKRQVGVALCVLWPYGIPLFSFPYAGNIHDAKVFKHVADKIIERFKKFQTRLKQLNEQVIFVCDKGNNSKENISLFDEEIRDDFLVIGGLTPYQHQDLCRIKRKELEKTHKPYSTLTTGTTINNIATIVFDWNPLMDTPLVFNTIDAGAPISAVAGLPAQSIQHFPVTWEGQDDEWGSGLAVYDIYCSDNGADYQPWLQDTTATSAIFQGQAGHTYSFYSVAIDNLGNREAPPSVADAVTTAVANTPPSAPHLNTPADMASIKTMTPTLCVQNSIDQEADPLTYAFEIYDTVDLTPPAVASVTAIEEGNTTTSWQCTTPLQEDTWYFWRARAFDGIDYSPWTGKRPFLVNNENNPPEIPIILAPDDLNKVNTLQPDFIIANSIDPDGEIAISYEFEIYVDPEMNERIAYENINSGLEDTTTWTISDPLFDRTWYYWQVRSTDGKAYSEWNRRSFYVDINTIEHSILITQDNNLKQWFTLHHAPTATTPEIGPAIASYATPIGNAKATSTKKVFSVVAGDFDADGVQEIAVLFQSNNAPYGQYLNIYEAPQVVGEPIPAPTASFRWIGTPDTFYTVTGAVAGDFMPGHPGDEIGLLKENAATGGQRIVFYAPPTQLNEQIPFEPNALATYKWIGFRYGLMVISASSGDYNNDGITEIGFVFQNQNPVSPWQGTQLLYVYTPPSSGYSGPIPMDNFIASISYIGMHDTVSSILGTCGGNFIQTSTGDKLMFMRKMPRE